MSEDHTIRVNFARPVPVFPLHTVELLPHMVRPLHIFEPRYRRMLDDTLDGPGQIAMAVFEGERWMQEYHGRPPLREAVCIGQIVQHNRYPDGRYDIMVQGVCRAKILHEVPPAQQAAHRSTDSDDAPSFESLPPYREAFLEPVLDDEDDSEEAHASTRARLVKLLSSTPLSDLRNAKEIVEHVRYDEVPAALSIELISFILISNPEVKYRLLEEGRLHRRVNLIENEFSELARLLRLAAPQRAANPPKGCFWN